MRFFGVLFFAPVAVVMVLRISRDHSLRSRIRQDWGGDPAGGHVPGVVLFCVASILITIGFGGERGNEALVSGPSAHRGRTRRRAYPDPAHGRCRPAVARFAKGRQKLLQEALGMADTHELISWEAGTQGWQAATDLISGWQTATDLISGWQTATDLISSWQPGPDATTGPAPKQCSGDRRNSWFAPGKPPFLSSFFLNTLDSRATIDIFAHH